MLQAHRGNGRAGAPLVVLQEEPHRGGGAEVQPSHPDGGLDGRGGDRDPRAGDAGPPRPVEGVRPHELLEACGGDGGVPAVGLDQVLGARAHRPVARGGVPVGVDEGVEGVVAAKVPEQDAVYAGVDKEGVPLQQDGVLPELDVGVHGRRDLAVPGHPGPVLEGAVDLDRQGRSRLQTCQEEVRGAQEEEGQKEEAEAPPQVLLGDHAHHVAGERGAGHPVRQPVRRVDPVHPPEAVDEAVAPAGGRAVHKATVRVPAQTVDETRGPGGTPRGADEGARRPAHGTSSPSATTPPRKATHHRARPTTRRRRPKIR